MEGPAREGPLGFSDRPGCDRSSVRVQLAPASARPRSPVSRYRPRRRPRHHLRLCAAGGRDTRPAATGGRIAPPPSRGPAESLCACSPATEADIALALGLYLPKDRRSVNISQDTSHRIFSRPPPAGPVAMRPATFSYPVIPLKFPERAYFTVTHPIPELAAAGMTFGRTPYPGSKAPPRPIPRTR